MKASIFRLLRFPKEKLTPGVLFSPDNKKVCDTLEDIVRDLNADGDLQDEGEEKVYGETAIPYNTYELKVTYSPHFGKKMTLVCDVPEFTGIRMHWARTVKQLLGCVGMGKANGDTLDDTGMTDKMTAMVEELQKEGKVYLEIVKS